jgi:protein required for attachment to host cells
MQQQASTWIVVADAGRARILEYVRAGAQVHRVFEQDDAASERVHNAMVAVVRGGADTGSYARLVLVAAPARLAELRRTLGERARARVHHEHAEDLSRFSDEQIVMVLAEALAPARARAS